MSKLIPNMYAKDIFKINYKKLKEKNIKVLLFDFDNTIIEKGNNKPPKELKELISKIKKDFAIYVVSNSLNNKKLEKVCRELKISYIGNARKPSKTGYKKLKLEEIKENQIAMIGDQLITDVLGANRMGYYSILIDPITNNEHIWTKVNRKLENQILKKHKQEIERGKYYD